VRAVSAPFYQDEDNIVKMYSTSSRDEASVSEFAAKGFANLLQG
jgi:hypothetical protein